MMTEPDWRRGHEPGGRDSTEHARPAGSPSGEQSHPAAWRRPTPTDSRPGSGLRPRVSGRFLYVGDEKLWVRGVTYGTFPPIASGDDGYQPVKADADFARMASVGINATAGLRCRLRRGSWTRLSNMGCGSSWACPGSSTSRSSTSADAVRRAHRGPRQGGRRELAGHPAMLAFASATRSRARRALAWRAARRVVPGATSGDRPRRGSGRARHVRQLPVHRVSARRVIDFVAANVYLEETEQFEGYVARLQTLAGIGAWSSRCSARTAAGASTSRRSSSRTQVRATFALGGRGTFVFAWTDEWVRTARPWSTGTSGGPPRP